MRGFPFRQVIGAKRRAGSCIWLALWFCLWASTTSAQHLVQADTQRGLERFESFSGIGVTENAIFGYAGGAWALGRPISEPGARVKGMIGVGAYQYSGSLSGVAGSVNFDGDVSMAQFLAGYQWRRNEWTIKAYAGVGYQNHNISPSDPTNAVQGSETGALGQIELWRNIGGSGFLSFDTSYAQPFDGYSAKLRLGRRVSERFSAGLEAGALGNEEYDSGRGGLFLRLHRGRTEITLSGGLSGDYLTQDLTGYAGLGWYEKF